MTLPEFDEKKKYLSRCMAEGIPVKVKDSPYGRTLLEQGITEVYLRRMTVIRPGLLGFDVNPDRVANLRPMYQLTDEDLETNHAEEGGTTDEGGNGGG